MAKKTVLVALAVGAGLWLLLKGQTPAEAAPPSEVPPEGDEPPETLPPSGWYLSPLWIDREAYALIPLNISTTVTNGGATYGSYIYRCKVDGVLLDKKFSVTLDPGESQPIYFPFTPPVAKTYFAEIDGGTLEFTAIPYDYAFSECLSANLTSYTIPGWGEAMEACMIARGGLNLANCLSCGSENYAEYLNEAGLALRQQYFEVYGRYDIIWTDMYSVCRLG